MNFVFVCLFLNKALIKKKKRIQNPESPQRQICVFVRQNVYHEDKLWMVSKEIFFTPDKMSIILSKKKNFTLLKYIIQNSFMCNMLNSK